MTTRRLASTCLLCLLAACSSTPTTQPPQPLPSESNPRPQPRFALGEPTYANEIVLYALGLIDTGYRFGGSNPDAGLDCSGMVAYIVQRVSGQRLPHNAAQIAAITRPIERAALQPADLVFFNTNGQAYSHMGIYLGDGRFVHAPSSKGKVRIERLDNVYFARRFTAARTMF
jgi:cell wall-associated NlpC family hydrolase